MKKELMKLLKIDDKTAEKVLYEMDCSGIDYSECTQREFNATARECLELVNAKYGSYKSIDDMKTDSEILEWLLHEIKWHNDGDTDLEEFAVNIMTLRNLCQYMQQKKS